MKKQITFLFLAFTLFLVSAQQSVTKVIPFENNGSRIETGKMVFKPGDKKDKTTFVRPESNSNAVKNMPGKTVAVKKSGNILKSINQFPWTEGFEGETFPPDGWTLIDNDGDGINWGLQLVSQSGLWNDIEGYNSNHAVGSASYRNDVKALSPDNWLITPALEIPDANFELKYMVGAVDQNYYYDHYEVMVSTTGTDIADFTSIFEETLTTSIWQERRLSLSAYAGETIYIAFVHNDSEDIYIMRIDDINVRAVIQVDAELVSITKPVSGTNLTDTETASVIVKNNGKSDISNLKLYLYANGEIINSHLVSNTTHAPGAEKEYTFPLPLDLSAAGEYIITAEVELAGDEVVENNSKTVTVKNIVCSTISTFPYTAGFEDPDEVACWSMESDDNSPVSWSIGTGAGNSSAVTTAHMGTYNLVFGQTSSTIYTTKLVMPELDLTSLTSPSLNFWFAAEQWENDQNELRVYYKTTAAGSWTKIFESTSNVDKWTNVILALPSPSSEYYIAFEGTSKYGHKLVIDDVVIDELALNDAAVMSLNTPIKGAHLTAAESVSITIKNQGKNTITSLPVEVLVDGTIVLSETITASIPSLTEYTYIFNGTVDLSAVQKYEIKVRANLPGDEVTGNDELTKNVENYGNYAIMGSVDHVTSCDIGFADDGFSDNYIPKGYEIQTITFHPENTGDRVKVEFTELVISEYFLFMDVYPIAGDTLFAYEGTLTNKENLIAYFSGDYTDNLPTITSFSDDGALTFIFKKLSGFDEPGWKANVSCVTPSAIDMKVEDITPARVVTGTTVIPTVKIRNAGATEATAWSVNLNDGELYTSTFNGTTAIPAGKELTVTMDEWLVTAASTASLTATVTITDDGDPANNELIKTIPTGAYAGAYTANANSSETYMTLDLTNGDVAEAGNYVSDEFPSGEDYDGEYIYRIYGDNKSFGKVYPDGFFEKLGTMTGVAAEDTPSGLAYDWDNDIWYMGAIHKITSSGSTEYYFSLYTLDIADFTATLVGTSTSQCFNRGLDMAGGYLYTVSILDSNLFKIDPANASITSVGATGLSLNYGQDISYDMADNKLYTIAFDYRASNDYSAKFGTYDLSTGAFTEIKDYGVDQFSTICITKALLEKTPVGDNVEKNAVVSVTFDKDIAVADLSKIIIYPVPGNVAGVVAGKVLTIAHDDFEYETEYTVVIPAGTLTGYTKPISWSFSTESDPTDVNHTEAQDITLYPNPASTMVKLSGIPENSDVAIYDISGRIVKQYKAATSTLDIKIDFENGSYIVRMEKDGNITVRKLIVK